jgi:hypothetical protein
MDDISQSISSRSIGYYKFNNEVNPTQARVTQGRNDNFLCFFDCFVFLSSSVYRVAF